MELLIVIEILTAIFFIVLAIIAGYRGNKVLGAVIFGVFAVLISLIFVVSTPLIEYYLVDSAALWISPLVEGAFILTGLATLLGYLGNKTMGAAMLAFGAILASAICIVSTLSGYYFGAEGGAWVGLLAGIVLTSLTVPALLGKFIRGRSARFLAGIWIGFCALCILGYLAGGSVGLLTITLPAIAIFRLGLYRISGYILPLRDKQNKKERLQALRSLLTFTMGTNYPYYFVDNEGKLDERVKGNPYLQFFAGPGIVYTDCEHAAYVTNGTSNNRVFEPGLSFTQVFDLPPRIIDLQPQLRAFPVEALTKDGIPIEVVTFISVRIDTSDRQVELGQSFPFRRRAVFKAIAGELTERKQQKEESGNRHKWDGELVPTIATRVVQDVISQYNVDELCTLPDPGSDPRDKIASEIGRRVKEALLPLGLELVGGGISNLIPQDEAVKERRLDSWRTEWQHRIFQLKGKGEAEGIRQIQTARAEAETEIVLRLSRIVEESIRSGAGLSQTALALRFVDCLGEIASEAGSQWPLPDDVKETLKRLRGGIETREY